MRKRLRVDREADDEIAGGIEWYEAQRPGLGHDFLGAIRDAMHSLRAPGPECRAAVGVPIRLGVRRKLVKQFPYVILFVELDAFVRVIAVAHVGRRPGYWRSRI